MRFQFVLFVAFLASFAMVKAQNSDTLSLDEMVVTANKIPQSQRKTIRPVQVITRSMLDAAAGKDLAQILNDQAGVIINGSYSNPGKDKAIYLRGAGNQYVLLLIDGIPAIDPSGPNGGAIDVRLLSANQFERIEIAPGSHSTLYGTDAVGGVINLITRKTSDRKAAIHADLSGGSFNTLNTQASVSGQATKWLAYQAGFGRFSSQGISEAENPTDSLIFDNDGLTQQNWQGALVFTPIKELNLRVYKQFNRFVGDYDNGAFDDSKKNSYEGQFDQNAVNLAFKRNRFSIAYDLHDQTTTRKFITEFGDYPYLGRIFQNELRLAYQATDRWNILLGVQTQNMKLADTVFTASSPKNSTISPFIQVIGLDVAGFNVEAGARYIDHSDFGGHATYSLGLSRWFSQVKTYATYATAFKSPTLNELFGPFGGNPDLKPQEAVNMELGAEYYGEKLQAGLAVYKRDIDNLIIYTFSRGKGYINADNQTATGITTNVQYRISPALTLQAAYDYVDGTLKTVSESGKDTSYFNLLRIPKHRVLLGVQATPWKQLRLGVQVQTLTERDDLFFNSTTFASEKVVLDSYALVNLTASYTLAKQHLILYADVKNLLNTDFQEVYGYATPGTNIQAGVRINW